MQDELEQEGSGGAPEAGGEACLPGGPERSGETGGDAGAAPAQRTEPPAVGEGQRPDGAPFPESGGAGPEADGREARAPRPPLTEEQVRQMAGRLAAAHTAREVSRQARRQEITARIGGELREIAALDPEVRTLEDLRDLPGYGRICARVERGCGLADAYRLENFDALAQRAARSARQAALNSVAGREHLLRTAVRGEGAAPVPPDLAAEYRALVPGAGEGEIQAHYNRYLRSLGGAD